METFSDIPSKQKPLQSAQGATAEADKSKVGAISTKAGQQQHRRSPTRKINGHGRKGSGSALEGGGGGALAKPGTASSSASCLISYLFYLLCITSLGATIYSNIRQSYLEDRLFSLVSIEERLSLLETQIRDVYRSSRVYAAGPKHRAEDQEESVSDIVRKISLQIAELPRIRRDVSTLKLSRTVRQASVQPMEGECMCPPGKLPPLFNLSKLAPVFQHPLRTVCPGTTEVMLRYCQHFAEPSADQCPSTN